MQKESIKIACGEYVSEYIRMENGQEAGRKLVVLFPGRGYNSSRPLLYFSKKLALELGFDVLDVGYMGFKDRADMQRVLPEAMFVSKEVLRQLPLEQYYSVCMISKSFGTMVAGALAMLWEDQVSENVPLICHYYLTPLRETVRYMLPDTYRAAIGMADYYTSWEEIQQIGWNTHPDFLVLPGGTHSLEIEGDVIGSIDMIQTVMQDVKRYLIQFGKIA